MTCFSLLFWFIIYHNSSLMSMSHLFSCFRLHLFLLCYRFQADSQPCLIYHWLCFLHCQFCSLLLKRRGTPCCWVFSSLNSFLLNLSLIPSHLRLVWFCFILILFFIIEVEELSSRKEKNLWSHYTVHLKLETYRMLYVNHISVKLKKTILKYIKYKN